MKIEKDNSITISGFEGIGQSILSDFSDMMGINTENNPGVASANFKFNKTVETIAPQTFTVITDNIVTPTAISYRGQEDYIPVTCSTTGTLPTGITAGTIYYLIKTADKTYKLQTTLKGSGYAAITAGTGSGTHTVTPITPKRLMGITQNGQGRLFAQDSDGRVWFGGDTGDWWYLLAGNTITASSGNSIIFYKGYILVFRNAYISALLDIQSITDTLVWTNDFVTKTSSTVASPFLSVNDDAIYFNNGSSGYGSYYQIGLLEENAGETFDPTDSSTFSFVGDATTLPNENGKGEATAINEISQYLIIGTSSNKLFFWDKKSPSFTTFLTLQEYNTKRIEVIGDTAYVFAGINGSVYIANTVSATRLFRIPEQITNQYYGNVTIEYTASCIFQREILFAVKIGVKCYLMSYNIDTKKLIKKNISSFGESLTSTSTVSATQNGYISYIFGLGDNIIIGSSYYSFTTSAFTYAIESLLYRPSLLSGSATYYCYDNYEANIVTGLMPVGENYNKKTYRELQVSLLRSLSTSQGVKVYYRLDDNSAWTLLKTIDYTTNGAIKDIKLNAPITDIIDLQIKIELNGYNLTSPMLKLIRLIP